MVMLPGWSGLQWNVYKNYYFKDREGKTYITTDFSNDNIDKTYNPNINDDVDPPTRRNTLFALFAKTELSKEGVLKFVNKYGLLTESAHKVNAFETVRGDLLETIYTEIKLLNKAWLLYNDLKKYEISELRKKIEIEVATKTLNKDLDNDTIEKNVIVKPKLKKDLCKFNIYLKKDSKLDGSVYSFCAFFYLLELTTEKIKEHGGAFPHYMYIRESNEKDMLTTFGYYAAPSFECNNLISALWIQFYNLLIQGHGLIKCHYEGCNNLVEKKRRKLYCSDACRSKQNTNNFRRRHPSKK